MILYAEPKVIKLNVFGGKASVLLRPRFRTWSAPNPDSEAMVDVIPPGTAMFICSYILDTALWVYVNGELDIFSIANLKYQEIAAVEIIVTNNNTLEIKEYKLPLRQLAISRNSTVTLHNLYEGNEKITIKLDSTAKFEQTGKNLSIEKVVLLPGANFIFMHNDVSYSLDTKELVDDGLVDTNQLADAESIADTMQLEDAELIDTELIDTERLVGIEKKKDSIVLENLSLAMESIIWLRYAPQVKESIINSRDNTSLDLQNIYFSLKGLCGFNKCAGALEEYEKKYDKTIPVLLANLLFFKQASFLPHNAKTVIDAFMFNRITNYFLEEMIKVAKGKEVYYRDAAILAKVLASYISLSDIIEILEKEDSPASDLIDTSATTILSLDDDQSRSLTGDVVNNEIDSSEY